MLKKEICKRCREAERVRRVQGGEPVKATLFRWRDRDDSDWDDHGVLFCAGIADMIRTNAVPEGCRYAAEQAVSQTTEG